MSLRVEMKSGEVFIDREKFEMWTEDLAAHRASFLLGRRKHPLSPKKEKPFSALDCFMLNRTARIQGNVPFLSVCFHFKLFELVLSAMVRNRARWELK